MAQRVAVVTGSNKGIGLAIVKNLVPQFDGVVYLTARNEKLGLQAIEELAKQNVKPLFHQLDISNQESINRFAQYIKEKHGGLDLLINNAAIAIVNKENPSLFGQEAKQTLDVNYYGTLNMCKAFFPLLRPHARVVNVASGLGMLKFMIDEETRSRLKSDALTVQEIDEIIQHYLKAANNGDEHKSIVDNDYGSYTFSKIVLIALTRLQQKELDKDPREDLIISACCPGYVATDLNNHSGFLTTDQGSVTPLKCALSKKNTEA